jgi:hypothetical protein
MLKCLKESPDWPVSAPALVDQVAVDDAFGNCRGRSGRRTDAGVSPRSLSESVAGESRKAMINLRAAGVRSARLPMRGCYAVSATMPVTSHGLSTAQSIIPNSAIHSRGVSRARLQQE